MNDEQTHVRVRYEEHSTTPGGSIWVQVQNRPYNYNDEWLCIWSTDPGSREVRLSMMNPGFDEVTTPAADIAIPVSWLPRPAVIEGTTVGGELALPTGSNGAAPVTADPVIEQAQVAQ